MKEPVSPAFAAKDGGSSARQHEKILAMVQIALFTAIIAVCSWIQIPLVVPFTLQTFGVFCALAILGGKSGTISVLLYIVLGTIGVPVFAGFSGGIGTLLGMTGGYIIGFLFSALIYWGITRWLGEKLPVMILAMVLGLAACYADRPCDPAGETAAEASDSPCISCVPTTGCVRRSSAATATAMPLPETCGRSSGCLGKLTRGSC